MSVLVQGFYNVDIMIKIDDMVVGTTVFTSAKQRYGKAIMSEWTEKTNAGDSRLFLVSVHTTQLDSRMHMTMYDCIFSSRFIEHVSTNYS